MKFEINEIDKWAFIKSIDISISTIIMRSVSNSTEFCVSYGSMDGFLSKDSKNIILLFDILTNINESAVWGCVESSDLENYRRYQHTANIGDSSRMCIEASFVNGLLDFVMLKFAVDGLCYYHCVDVQQNINKILI